MALFNQNLEPNEHGIVDDSKKGYCFLYFAMFLFCLLGAIFYVYYQNWNSVPEIFN